MLPPAIALALRESGGPVIVTGTGGWLGRATLAALGEVFGTGLAANVQAFSSTPGRVELGQGGITTLPYAALGTLRAPPAYILHFAFRTKGHEAEPGYVETNHAIATTLRGFIGRNGARGLFIPSSGAVYGADSSTYGMLKYEDEVQFSALAERLGFPAVIMRIFNLAGPYMNNLSGYALGCIITDILRGGPIRLRAARPVWRAYTHVGDVLSIALALLLQGRNLPVFDTGGVALELGTLAERAAGLLGWAGMEIMRPDWAAGVPDRYLGDVAAYTRAATLAGVTLRPLAAQIRDTAAYIKPLC